MGQKIITLAEHSPEIALEWDYEKNYPKTPDKIGHGSTKYCWWICPKGHPSYLTRVDHRTLDGSGCPCCAGTKPIPGETDLATVFPDIANEWDYSRNEKSPQEYLPFSNDEVFWKCPYCGNSYDKKISERTKKRSGCRNCAKEKGTSFQEQSIFFYLKKITDAENRYFIHGKEIDIFLPEFNIGIEYNGEYYHKNKKISDNKKRDFLREKGIRIISVDEADENSVDGDTVTVKTVNYHVSDNDLKWCISALFCILHFPVPLIDVAKEQIAIMEQYIISQKKNNLVNMYPKIAAEWDTERNGNLKPDFFTRGAHYEAYWHCSICDEIYKSAIYNRINGQGCPVGSGKKVKVGYNDLCTTHPEIAKQWSDKNGNKRPEQFTAGADTMIIWHCEKCGQDWTARLYSRKSRRGCPICSGRKIVAGVNDLQTKRPEIAKEWHPTKNGTVLPSQVAENANKKYWWLCSVCGHEWSASPNTRVSECRCPECGKKNRVKTSKQTILSKRGSLAENRPDLVDEWDYEANYPLTPDTVTTGSKEEVGWVCKKGHKWNAVIYSRKHRGCPECGKKRCVETSYQNRLSSRGSVSEKRPDLAAEWDYEANYPLTPDMFTVGSKKKVGWICKNGHKWNAVIYSRKKCGCPICAGKGKRKG